MYEKYFKRYLDFFLALIAAIVFSPVIVLVAILVKIKLGSPVIFKQERPGLNEKKFTMYKFRTMLDKRNNEGELLADGDRLTKFGFWLRSTSLDELPELWNIIKGDMSLVGPRPLLVEYLPLYSEVQRKRHSVRPGLTGLSQISGRNLLPWEERFELDVKYIQSITFITDIKILIKTFKEVISRKGVSSKLTATMHEFTGKE